MNNVFKAIEGYFIDHNYTSTPVHGTLTELLPARRLEKKENKWKIDILMHAFERQSTVTLRIEDDFRSAQQTMDWVASKLEDMSVGIAGSCLCYPYSVLLEILACIMLPYQNFWR